MRQPTRTVKGSGSFIPLVCEVEVAVAKRAPRAGSFLFDVDAFRFDPVVLQMSRADRGTYVFLLCSLWKMERAGVCVDDDSVLCQLAGCTPQEWAESRPQIARAFDTTSQRGFWVQKRMVQTKTAQDRFMDRQRESGKRGGKAKATNQQARVATILPLGSLERASSPSVSASASASVSESVSVEEKQRQKRDTGTAPRSRFTPPTIADVSAYCLERAGLGNPPVDPGAWMAHYESNGFRVGKNPMSSWKAAVRTWEKNGHSNGHGKGRGGYLDATTVLAFARQRRKDEEAASGKN